MKFFAPALVAAAVIFVAGCTPKLANRELGREEKEWKAYLEPMYPGWKVPATLPPAVAERSDALPEADDNAVLPPVVNDNDFGLADASTDSGNSADQSLTGDNDKDAAAVRFDEYVVQKDDTLSHIAKKFYGNGRKYYRILKANEDIIKNQNRIYPGMKIRIPRP